MRKNEVERVGGRGKQRWWWAARMELQWSVEMKHKGEVTCFLFLDLQVSRLFLISHNFCLIIIFLIYIYMDIYIYIYKEFSFSIYLYIFLNKNSYSVMSNTSYFIFRSDH